MGEKKILDEGLITQKLEEFANKVIARQPREYMTFAEFREKIADWSDTTIRRRHKEEGFPLVRDGGGFLIPRAKMNLWFKQREALD